MDIDMLA